MGLCGTSLFGFLTIQPVRLKKKKSIEILSDVFSCYFYITIMLCDWSVLVLFSHKSR